MNSEKQTRRKQQRGVAMVMALLALLVLAIIGMAFMTMGNTESSANRNYKDAQRAYFASRAGLENVRTLLWKNAALNAQATALSMPVTSANTGILYVLNSNGADNIDPTANSTLDDELCQEQFARLVAPATAQPTGTPIVGKLGGGTPIGTPPTGTPGTGLLPGTLGAPCSTGPSTGYFQTVSLTAADIPNTNTSSALPFKWVRITNKQNFMPLMNKNVDGTPVPSPNPGNQVCWDGSKEWSAPPGTCATFNPAQVMNPVWLLTSLAVTPAGSRRMAEMEVAFTPPISVNATIATSGTIKLTGKVTVNGNDDCTANKSHLSVYSGQCVPGTKGCSAAITNQVPPDQLTGNNGQTGVTVYDSTGAVQTSPPGQGSTGQGSWPYNVDQIINRYKQMAQSATGSPWNYNCGNNCTVKSEQFGTFPTDPVTKQVESTSPNAADGTPAIVYVPGNLDLSSPKATGDGLLIVDGDLTVHGGLEYYGLILVKGQITFTGGGSTPVNLFGAILAGDSASASDSVGGSFSFHYSSCALNQTAPPGPPRMLATHEIMY
jgi:hypothetical protein